jgi:tyrosyl-tRNA synthetase
VGGDSDLIFFPGFRFVCSFSALNCHYILLMRSSVLSLDKKIMNFTMACTISFAVLSARVALSFSGNSAFICRVASRHSISSFPRQSTVIHASTLIESAGSLDDAIKESDTSIYAKEAEALAQIKSPFLKILRDRGYLHQCTNVKELDNRLTKSISNPEENSIVSAYLGFDATADSLHVGSLLQIMILRHFQKCGHKPIVLVGGGTSKVGDPTGKDESRKLLTDEVIKQNTVGISKVFEKFLTFESELDKASTSSFMVDNDSWLSQLKYLEFLRDYGTQFTINRMMSFESVKQRLEREAPFSFLEFNYMILQAYDFLELHRRVGVTLQMGGADQWGNIVSGIELGRRCDGASLIGLTAPLITTSDGKKMGKTEGGAMWLNEDKFSKYDYWQFWRNTADDDVVRFLKLFTEMPLEEIAKFETLKGAEINEAKIVLADEATSLLHGRDCLPEIRETIKSMFSGGGQSLESLPRINLTSADVEGEGKKFIDLFVEFGFASSKKEARRLIQGGGARIGDDKITEELGTLSVDDFAEGNEVVLRAGKKRAGVVSLQ